MRFYTNTSAMARFSLVWAAVCAAAASAARVRPRRRQGVGGAAATPPAERGDGRRPSGFAWGLHDAKNHFFYEYYHRKLSEGKTKRQALKCLQRRLVNIIWAMLTHGEEYVNPPMFEMPKENEKEKKVQKR